jgi:hypothetical protein
MRNAVVAIFVCSCAAPTGLRPDVTRIDDAGAWSVRNSESHTALEDGRHVLKLAPIGGNRKGSNVGMALVANMTFAEGSIDVDLRGQGEATASFLGIAFGVADEHTYEAVYFRPFRFRASDAVQRTHAVQYIAWPDNTWEALRTRAPGVYEAAIAAPPDPAAWFHAHIEVSRTTVKVFVDGAARPALVVQRLAATNGKIGLWVDSQEGSFANLRVQSAT